MLKFESNILNATHCRQREELSEDIIEVSRARKVHYQTSLLQFIKDLEPDLKC